MVDYTGPVDRLAANSIIDFDANAYVKGTPPRYIGNPGGYPVMPFDQPLPAVPGLNAPPMMYVQPAHDRFSHSNHTQQTDPNPSWKKALLGVTLVGAAVFTAIKVKNSKFLESLKKMKTTLTEKIAKETPKVKNTVENLKNTKKIPKWVKVTGIGALALAGLYALFSMFGGNKTQHHG